MRMAALALAVLGASVSLYVAFAAYQNYPTVDSKSFFTFFVLGCAFALVGVVGGALTWRRRMIGAWLLLLGAIGGLLAWPWLVPAIIYLLAVAVSVVSHRMAPGTRPIGRVRDL